MGARTYRMRVTHGLLTGLFTAGGQRLGGQRLERVRAWRHGGAQRRHGGCLSRLHEGGASAERRAPSGRRNTYSAAERNFQGGQGRETGRRW